MDEGKSGPLDGIIEDPAEAKETVTENHKPRITNIGGTGPLPDDGIRRLRENAIADVTAMSHQLKTLQAMILALRGAVGAAALAAIIALWKTRKLEKRVGELEGSKKKVIEIEATATAPKAVVETVPVGD